MLAKLRITLVYKGFKEQEARKLLEEGFKAIRVDEVGRDYVIIDAGYEMLVKVFYGSSLAIIDAIVTKRGFINLLDLLRKLHYCGLEVANFYIEVSAH